MKGVCSNNNCSYFSKEVWVSKGYGKFDILKEKCVSTCPHCQKLMNVDAIKTLGFSKARLLGTGMVLNKKNMQEERSIRNEERDGYMIYYDDSESSCDDWIYIYA